MRVAARQDALEPDSAGAAGALRFEKAPAGPCRDAAAPGGVARFYAGPPPAPGGEEFEKECGIPAVSKSDERDFSGCMRSNVGFSRARRFEAFARRCSRDGVRMSKGGWGVVGASVFGALAMSVLAVSTHAATTGPGPIYTCINAQGKRLTSDRLIAECSAKEQRLLNADGSLRQVIPPTMTAEERAEVEARERQQAAERLALQDAVRRDRNLLMRYPDEAAHNKARALALDDVQKSVELSEKRLAVLASERKPLLDEAEFYVGRQQPLKLRSALDANDAATEAQRTLIQNQQAENVRINALFDAELSRLKRLWAGAPPGSMGAIPAPARRAAK
jgi:hypothetical protein